MAGKYEFISTLAKETAKDVTRNPESWVRYLNTAARLYRYPFIDPHVAFGSRLSSVLFDLDRGLVSMDHRTP